MRCGSGAGGRLGSVVFRAMTQLGMRRRLNECQGGDGGFGLFDDSEVLDLDALHGPQVPGQRVDLRPLPGDGEPRAAARLHLAQGEGGVFGPSLLVDEARPGVLEVFPVTHRARRDLDAFLNAHDLFFFTVHVVVSTSHPHR